MKRTYIIAAFAAAIVVPSLALAAMDKNDDKHHGMEKMFERHDINKDGKVTKDEMSQKKMKFFDIIDADKDGAITLEEAKKGRKAVRMAHKAEMMKKIDTDGNGLVSEAEFTAIAAKKFKKMDANGDGNLSMEELEKMRGHRMKGGKHGMHKSWMHGMSDN